jgi:N-acetylmuramoyl-L-alanine amidase
MMKRTVVLLFAFCFSILLLSFIRLDSLGPKKATIRTLIIDPGHGGTYPGAKGLISQEKKVSLEVAMKFGEALQKQFPDLKIIYTRTTDANAGNKTNLKEDLHYRANLANSSGGDLFISIHCNATGRRAGGWYEKVVTSRTPYTKTVGKGKKRRKVTAYHYKYKDVWRENTTRGTETYIWALSKNDAKVNSMNQIEYYGEIDSTESAGPAPELPDPSDPAEKARMLIYAQHYFRKSYDLADMVEKEFVASGRISRGVKQRNDEGIWVLQATGMPSILVEIGFITNEEEEKYINSDAGQDEIVEDLVGAFRAYKEKLEAKSISTSP